MSGDFEVWFTNIMGCAIGISDISLKVAVSAGSDAEAMEAAIVKAWAVNQDTGLPPHGIRVDEKWLRGHAVIWKRPAESGVAPDRGGR
jgi:hypothetical protein